MQKLISKPKNLLQNPSCIDGSNLQDSRTGNIHYVVVSINPSDDYAFQLRCNELYQSFNEHLKLNKIIKLQELYLESDNLLIDLILREELPAEFFFRMAKIIKHFFKNSDLKLEIKVDPDPDVDDIISITICNKEPYKPSDFHHIQTLDSLLDRIQEQETKRIIPNFLINLEYV